MYKLLALYRKPANPIEFDRHYSDVHTPLVQQIPGLTKLVVNRGIPPSWGGESAFYLIAEMHFADEASFAAAMNSQQMRAVGKDAKLMGGGLMTLATVREA
jgi:uncharacterized protein (TIGR02118 family)